MDLHPHDHPKALFDALAADPRVGRVTVRLRGGDSFAGTIGPTGNEAVVIKALTGREFFDAYVRYDAIAAVEVQTRS
jgi:hypothetical protein